MSYNNYQDDSENFGVKAVITGVIAVAVIAFLLFISPFTVVGVGEKGIVVNLGKVDRVLDSGMHYKNPFTESVVKIDIQTQKAEATADAASADLQTVNTTLAVNYSVDSTQVADLYTGVGEEYVTRLIDPAIQEAVKAGTAKYTAEELITKRNEVTDAILSTLKAKLSQNHILVSSVSIINFDFSAGFKDAIEKKVTAEQNALAAKNLLEQKKYEAEQTIVTAEATAKSIRLQSDAANNEKYVALKRVEVQLQMAEKWDGKLPVNMYAGAPLPLLNVTQ